MKNVLKIVAIISMLLLTVFAGGCGKSQEEKYTEARNEFVALQQQFDKNIKDFENKSISTKKSANSDLEYFEEYIKLVGNFEKKANEKVQNMTEIAKGKLELTKDVEQVKNEYHKKYDFYLNLLPGMKENLNKIKTKK